MLGTLQYGSELLPEIEKIEYKNGQIVLHGVTTEGNGYLPEGSVTSWSWRGTDSKIIFHGRIANMFRDIHVNKGDTLRAIQTVEMT